MNSLQSHGRRSFLGHSLGALLVDDQTTDQQPYHYNREQCQHIHSDSFGLDNDAPLVQTD